MSTHTQLTPMEMISRRGGTISRRVVDFFVALPRRVRREPPDLLRAGTAFVLSFVFVVTVGTMVLPDPGRKVKPKPPTSPVSLTPSFQIPPGVPSVEAPRIDAPSTHHGDAAGLSAVNAVTEARDLTVSPVSNVSIGPRQTAAVAARPDSSVRGGIATITGITLWGTPSRPWVSISASGPIRYRLRNVEPDWVVVDVSRAQLALGSGKLPAGRGLVRQVRAGQNAPDVVRVVLELTEPVPVHVATSLDKTTIVVSLAAQEREKGSVPSTGTQQLAAARSSSVARFASNVQPEASALPGPGSLNSRGKR